MKVYLLFARRVGHPWIIQGVYATREGARIAGLAMLEQRPWLNLKLSTEEHEVQD
jgi:hypothetical protein